MKRRNFLHGAGGALLALPWMSSLAGRASAQATPPKRLVLMVFHQGLVRTRWMPSSESFRSGDISELLAPLNSVRDELFVVSGVGNPARHISSGDNHRRSNTTFLTNARPSSDILAGGMSIDQRAAQLLAVGSQRNSVLLPLTGRTRAPVFFSAGEGGISTVTQMPADPATAAEQLFADLEVPGTEAPTPTLAQRLRGRRSTIVDSVSSSLMSLRGRLTPQDRLVLDSHAAELHALSRRYADGGEAPMGAPSCSAPGTIASISEDDRNRDDARTTAQIDNMVRALACDVTRVGSLHFSDSHSPSFPWLFGGSTTACTNGFGNWHEMIHNGQPTGADSDRGVPNLMRGQLYYMDRLRYLIESLRDTADTDGSPMLDNTLVLCMTEFGSENHGTYNLPVLMAGAGVPQGHLASAGKTVGDVFAYALERLGAPGETLGETGAVNWNQMSDTWAWRGDVIPERFYNGGLLG